MNSLTFTLAALGSAVLLAAFPAQAQIIITEVDPTGSSTSTYAADWWELTNYGSSAVNISGWKMDDNSDSFSDAVALNGVSSIASGQSVVFIENTKSSTSQSTINALTSSFEQAWFGNNVPVGFTIGTYNGDNNSVSLGSGGDAVNVYNSSGVLQAGVSFGNAMNNVTFDNSNLKITNTGSTDGVISTLSVIGIHGTFKDADGEIGSPGAAPEPGIGTLLMFSSGIFAVCLWVRRKLHA